MNLMVFDLEMCQPSDAIIQIGAVLLDLQKGQIEETFDRTTNPGELPDRDIVELTGISRREVEKAEPLDVAAQAFWSTFHQSPVGDKLAAWGSVDFDCIWNQSPNPPPRRSVRTFDLKALVGFLRSVKGQSASRGMSLRSVVEDLGIQFDGSQHNALTDAKAEAEVILEYHREFSSYYVNHQ